MSITRAPRPTSNFYLLDKKISEDKRLSWAARGILIFLLGKPDHWTVSPAALTNETKGLKRSTGRDGVYAILKELAEVGYLQIADDRDASGSFAGTNYTVSETPVLATIPDTVQPDTVQPDTVQPDTANPPQVSIEGKQGLKGKQGLNIPAAPTALPTAAEVLPAKAKKARKPKADDALDTELQAACKATWSAYAGEYRARYGIDPVRNAKVNANVKDFVRRIGHSEAPGVAAFYVRNVSEAFVVRGCHALGTLLQNAEAYRTQWATGQSMTNTRAKQIDQSQANFSAADEAMALYLAKKGNSNA